MIATSHVAAISAAREKMHLKAVVSRTPKRAAYLADLYDGPRPLFTDDLTAITNDPSIQVVIVATPPNVRIDLIETLANAGKHILLEKPVARTMGEAEQVVEICERADVTLGMVFQHRMRAPSKHALRVIRSGVLGALGHVEISVPLWRDQAYYDELGRGSYERDGGGVLLTQAIHTIDLALSLTGPVESVQAMTATTPLHQMESEDLAVAGVRFASGAVGSFVATTASFPHGKETIALHYEQASVRITKDTLVVNWRDGRTEGDQADGRDAPVVPLSGGKVEWHQGIIEDFVDAIQQGRPPIVTGRDALVSHRFIEAIETSSRTGRVVSLMG